jgi:hypothetical protein
VAEVKLRACDVCGRHEDMPGVEILKVIIEVGDERARAELCQDDAKPLLEVMKKLPGAAKRRTARHDFGASMVDDPAEIPREGVNGA